MLSIVGNYALRKAGSGAMSMNDKQAPSTPSAYGDPMMETLLAELQPELEQCTDLRLYPTYAFFRVYKRGDVLERHRDRPSCEVSVTLALRYIDANLWPILLETPDGVVSTSLGVGDALIYPGCVYPHWREKFEGSKCAQVFLHYVDAEGPNAEWRFDKRPSLNTSVEVS